MSPFEKKKIEKEKLELITDTKLFAALNWNLL